MLPGPSSLYEVFGGGDELGRSGRFPRHDFRQPVHEK
jgi:hypothetical protein